MEILFSPGASHNPFEVVPLKQDHTLPVLPRMPLHAGEAPAIDRSPALQSDWPYGSAIPTRIQQRLLRSCRAWPA